jgi:hypothetical protein
MYVATLGKRGRGKGQHQDIAEASIYLPNTIGESVVIKQSPGSHSGLIKQLSDTEPKPKLLLLDELMPVLNSCGIQGSNLPPMLCTLWNKDETGDATKKGYQKAYAKLSILGGLAVSDPADFSKMFSANSVFGLEDRFIFGYSASHSVVPRLTVSCDIIEVQEVVEIEILMYRDAISKLSRSGCVLLYPIG